MHIIELIVPRLEHMSNFICVTTNKQTNKRHNPQRRNIAEFRTVWKHQFEGVFRSNKIDRQCNDQNG